MWKQLDQQNKELEEKRKQFEKEKAQYEEEQKSNDKKGLERSDSSSRSLKYVFNHFKNVQQANCTHLWLIVRCTDQKYFLTKQWSANIKSFSQVIPTFSFTILHILAACFANYLQFLGVSSVTFPHLKKTTETPLSLLS